MSSLPGVLQQAGLGQLEITLQGLTTFRNQVGHFKGDAMPSGVIWEASAKMLARCLAILLGAWCWAERCNDLVVNTSCETVAGAVLGCGFRTSLGPVTTLG